MQARHWCCAVVSVFAAISECVKKYGPSSKTVCRWAHDVELRAQVLGCQGLLGVSWDLVTDAMNPAWPHTYIHTYVRTYVHTYIHTYIYIRTYIVIP